MKTFIFYIPSPKLPILRIKRINLKIKQKKRRTIRSYKQIGKKQLSLELIDYKLDDKSIKVF